ASFSLAELQKQGIEEDRILLAVLGRVFDVSSGKDFYGEGESYRLFAGHDCSRAFALTKRQVEMLDRGLDGLSEMQLRHLNRTYWETYIKKYPVVGKLRDAPYNPVDYDHFAGPFARVLPTRPVLEDEDEDALGDTAPSSKPRESRCPVTRAAKAVSAAFVNLLPRQLLG
ncbi:unnamed protein product, partial [Effrenium voratum]